MKIIGYQPTWSDILALVKKKWGTVTHQCWGKHMNGMDFTCFNCQYNMMLNVLENLADTEKGAKEREEKNKAIVKEAFALRLKKKKRWIKVVDFGKKGVPVKEVLKKIAKKKKKD